MLPILQPENYSLFENIALLWTFYFYDNRHISLEFKRVLNRRFFVDLVQKQKINVILTIGIRPFSRRAAFSGPRFIVFFV